MNSLLLGGWRVVAEDVGRLAAGLKALPGTCSCGHGSAHLAGTCPCCRAGERTLDSGCTDCGALLASVRDKTDELLDATLRFLPFVEGMIPAGQQTELAQVRDLRRQVLHVTAVFQKLETAADEFRQGCTASHMPVLRELADELAVSTRELDARLRPVAGHAGRAPSLR